MRDLELKEEYEEEEEPIGGARRIHERGLEMRFGVMVAQNIETVRLFRLCIISAAVHIFFEKIVYIICMYPFER
jgi:hypothetical protein